MRFLKKSNGKISIVSILTLVYLFAFSIRFLSNASTVLTGAFWFFSGLLIFLYLNKKNIVNKRIMYMMITIDMIGFVNGYFNGNETYIQALYIFSAQIFGLMIFYFIDSIKITQIYFWLVFIYIALKIIFFPTIDIHEERAVSNLIGHSSVSIMMITACTMDLIATKNGRYNKSYILYILGIVVSYIADSNGGVVSFAFFLIGIYLCSAKGDKLIWWKVLLILIGGISALYAMGYLQKVIAFATDDNSRLAIWQMYILIATANFKSFFIGAPLTDNSILYTFYNNNMHNNFINWHVYFGIVPTIIFFGIVVYELFYYIKQKEWVYVMIAGALLVRSLPEGTDYCFMTLWVYMLLDIMNKKRHHNIARYRERKIVIKRLGQIEEKA